MRIDEITTKQIKQFLNDKKLAISEKTGRSYFKNAIRLMKAASSVVLTDAVEDEDIATNPAIYESRRKKPGGSRTKPKVRTRNAKQRERFLSVLNKVSLGALFETMIRTGLRHGEAYALQISDL